MSKSIVIDAKNLTKSFYGHRVVDGVNLEVKKGEVFGFLGPNGSGKTTTLRIICGLLIPDEGSGTCLGYDILKEPRKIKEHVGYMTQKFSFYTDLSIKENLQFVASVYGVKDQKKRIQDILQEFDLVSKQDQLAGELSGGWKQRLALAACILHEPELLLLDEPTAGIDPIARRDFWDRIHTLSVKGITTLMTTHYMDEAERCTRLAYIANGKLIITGDVNDVIKSTGLKTWEIRGKINPRLLQEVKAIDGILQAALFGRQIHVCGVDAPLINQGLRRLAKHHDIIFSEIESTLEDAFLRLVDKSEEVNNL